MSTEQLENKKEFNMNGGLQLDAIPFSCVVWDRHHNVVDCNAEAVQLFGLQDKRDLFEQIHNILKTLPPYGGGEDVLEANETGNPFVLFEQKIDEAFQGDFIRGEWVFQRNNGEVIPLAIDARRTSYMGEDTVFVYFKDNRELKASIEKVREADERAQVILDSNPLCCNFWDKDCNNVDCNQETVNLFSLSDKQEYLDNFYRLSPLYQPDGRLSSEKVAENVKQVFKTGYKKFDWMHQKLDGELIPTEIILVRVKQNDDYIVIGYTRDLRELIRNLDEIRKADERAQLMLDSTPLCCNYWDRDFNNIDCNQAAVNLFELSNKQEYLERFFELSPECQPDGQLSSTKAIEYIRTAFETGYSRFEWTHCKLNGELIPAEITLVRVESKDGYIVTGYTRDLREIKATMEEIRKADERAQIMLEATPLCCNLWDKNFNNIDCNQEAVNLFELSSKKEYLSRFFELSPEYQPDGRLSKEKAVEKIKTAFETGRTVFEWMHQKLDGELVPSEITLVRVRNKDGFIVAGYTRDLRELKATVSMLNQLEQLAFVDSLTDIYNRRYFMETAKKEFTDYEYRNSTMSILMMDIDNFKRINDTYGHIFGDKALKTVAATIKSVLRPSDLFARYGGEEFIIMIRNSSPGLAAKLAKRIRAAIEKAALEHNGAMVSLTISVGVATRMNHYDGLEDIILKADEALYRAKMNGRNRVEVN